MSSNPLYGLRKVGTFVQLTGLPGWLVRQLTCVRRLHAAAVRSAALVSDEKRITVGVYTRRCAIQITSFTINYYYQLLFVNSELQFN